MQFLDTVNRILRQNAIIRGDTDTVSTFSDTQHNASVQLAIVAVQDELVKLVSDRLIPYERKTTGSVSLVAATRTYALAADFIRFYGVAHFYRSSNNELIGEYPGGLERLQVEIPNYLTSSGQPHWFYFEPTTTKQVGFYQTPNASETLTYEYEGSVIVSSSTDTMPFHTTEENYAFAEMAARRFKFKWEDVKNEADIVAVLEKDRTYLSAKATLIHLIKGRNPRTHYGFKYE